MKLLSRYALFVSSLFVFALVFWLLAWATSTTTTTTTTTAAAANSYVGYVRKEASTASSDFLFTHGRSIAITTSTNNNDGENDNSNTIQTVLQTRTIFPSQFWSFFNTHPSTALYNCTLEYHTSRRTRKCRFAPILATPSCNTSLPFKLQVYMLPLPKVHNVWITSLVCL